MPVLLGALTALLSFIGSWIPSTWRDEAATAFIANHSPGEILAILRHSDAAFGLYYYAMSGWGHLAGFTPVALRLPGSLAAGVGAFAVAAAASRLGGARLGLASGAAFALLPRTMGEAIDARPYAMCGAATAVALWAAVLIAERPTRWRLLAFTGSAIIASYLHLYALLTVIAIAGMGVLLIRERRPRLFLAAGGALAVLATVPLALFARGQMSGQIGWLRVPSWGLLWQVGVEQYFPYRFAVQVTTPDQLWVRTLSVLLAVCGWGLVALAIASRRPEFRHAVVLCLGIVVVPTAVVVLYTLLVSPGYAPRYLGSTAPGFSILLGCGLCCPRRSWQRIVAVVVLVGLAVPIAVAQRRPFGKFVVDDFSFIAQTVEVRSSPGDLILFDTATTGPVESGRNAIPSYPQAFRKVDDIGARTRAEDLSGPWPGQRSLDEVTPRLATGHRVWLVSTPSLLRSKDAYVQRLRQLGFTETSESPGPTHTVTLWTRARP